MSESKKKVLIITYYWPPSGGAGVQRCLKFVKYLPSFGIEPHVYTVENGEYPSIDHSLEKDIPREAVVIKQPIWEPYPLFKLISGKKKDDKVQAGFISEDGKDSFVKKLSVWIRGNFLIPDPRRFWIKPSVKFLKKYIKENDIDVVLSSGPPHSMHMIALALKKQFPDLKWIADFRDPWTDIDFYKDLMLSKWADKKHHRMEKEVLQTADEIITVGPTLQKDLENIRGSKVQLITNGYDEADYPVYEGELDKEFTLSHVGSLNKDRNHPALWKVIGGLVNSNPQFKNHLKLQFVGPVDASLKASLEENNLLSYTEFIPPVSHSSVREYQQRSRVLMLFINRSPNAKGLLTGKMFEYLAAKRPIIAIGPVDGDVATIFRESNLDDLIDFDDQEGMKEFVLNQFEMYIQGKGHIGSENLKRFSRKALTKELVNFL